MDSTKLIAFVAGGSSASSMLSGSLFSEGGTRRPTVQLRMENPFASFDLACLEKYTYPPKQENPRKTIFEGFDDLSVQTSLINKPQSTMATSSLTLPTPKNTGNMEACYKVTFHQAVIPKPTKDKPNEKEWNVIAARIEMAASKGDYGILLLNVVWNTKHYGGKTNTFRAVFLEREKSKDWKVRGGVQWTDEALLRGSKDTRRVEIEGGSFGKKHIAWQKDFSDVLSYGVLVEKDTVPYSYLWKNESTQQKNIFQEIAVRPETQPAEPNSENFWNGTQEPIVANSSITKPVALYDVDERVWKKTRETINISTLKPWFDLFKNDKGKWEKK